MTGIDRGPGAPMGPPWSVDLLADLHAGVLDPGEASRLDAIVRSDPEAMAVLAALDATTDALHALPAPRMPDDVAARIDAALRAEASGRVAPPGIAPVVDLAAARGRRNRRLGWGAGLFAAAAAAVGITVAVLPHQNQTSGTPNAQATTSTEQTSAQPPLALRNDQLGGAAPGVIGHSDYGPLHNAETLSGCMKAVGVPGDPKPLGFQPIQLDGKQGVFIVLPAGKATYRLLVVGPSCGPDKADLLSDSTIGGK